MRWVADASSPCSATSPSPPPTLCSASRRSCSRSWSGHGDAADHRAQAGARALVLRREHRRQTALELRMINRVVPRDELRAATLKYAKRLALIAPEALAATKLAINRDADAGGFRNALQAGLDVVAPLYAATTEVGRQFEEIRSRDGLKAALKWRHAQLEAE